MLNHWLPRISGAVNHRPEGPKMNIRHNLMLSEFTPTGTELADHTAPPRVPFRAGFEPSQKMLRLLGHDNFVDMEEEIIEEYVDHTDVVFNALRLIVGTVVSVNLLRTLLTSKFVNYKNYLIGSPERRNYLKLVRDAFENLQIPESQPVPDHSHGHTRAQRNSVNTAIRRLCTSLGKDPYFYGASKSQSKDAGSREYYWAKDLEAHFRSDVVITQHAIVLEDVDYYVDMNALLCTHPENIFILSTFTPETTAGTTEDTAWRFKGNEVILEVNGGGRYQHPLWNYDLDTFVAVSGLTTVVYDVCKRRTSLTRSLVVLTPIRILNGLPAMVTRFLSGRRLERWNVKHGEYCRLDSTVGSERLVSISKSDSTFSVTIPKFELDKLFEIARSSKTHHLNSYQVKTNVNGDGENQGASLIANYVNEFVEPARQEHYYRDVNPVVKVGYGDVDPDTKITVVPFAKPFLTAPACAHFMDRNSSKKSVVERIEKPQQRVKNLKPLREFDQTGRSFFLEKLVPKVGILTKMDYEEVYERCHKPSQKLGLEKASTAGPFSKVGVSSFMKKEAYPEPKAPRNISTFPDKYKYAWAQYLHPVMDFMKALTFYAFGRKPVEIAEKVASICRTSRSACCPDVSKMDGHKNHVSRDLEIAFMLRLFGSDEHEEIKRLHSSTFNNKGYTEFGIVYEQDDSGASGSFDTSAFNTLIELEILFMAYARQYKAEGHADCYELAWEAMLVKAIAGGDDGLAGDLAQVHVENSAKVRGFTVTGDTFYRGDMGVNFLARVYGPHVWDGDATSVCDLKRQMAKFHLTVNTSLPPTVKLLEKARSFYLTDEHTPIIGDLCGKVLELSTKEGVEDTGTILRYWDRWDKDVQFPNEYSEWMDILAEEWFPVEDLEAFNAWIMGCKTIDEVLNCPVNQDSEEFVIEEEEVPELMKGFRLNDGSFTIEVEPTQQM